VGLLKSREEEIVIGGNEPGPITVSMRNELTGIQYGKVPDRHSWMVKLSR
jgi:branched-chain amino acid aminotransferase